MQGINISSVMAEAFKDNVPSGVVLLFDSTMPTNLGEVPFNPFINTFAELYALPEFVTMMRVTPKTSTLNTDITTVPFNSFDHVYGSEYDSTSFPIPLDHAWSVSAASYDPAANTWGTNLLYSEFRKGHALSYINFGVGAGSYIHVDVPDLVDELDNPISITGFGFIQRDITYGRLYQAGWGYDTTRATSASLDYYDPAANEGAGAWVVHQTFGTNVLQTGILNLSTPIVATGINQFRITCRGGATARSGATNVSGSPHWSVASVQLFSSQQAYIADTDVGKRTPTWGMFVPFADFGSYNTVVSGEFAYNGVNRNAPYLVFDVGAIGSGAGVELINPDTKKMGDTRISKFNINFQGFGS